MRRLLPAAARRDRLAVLLLLAVIVVNVAQFRFIDQRVIPHYRALHRFDTADVFRHPHWVSQEYKYGYGLHRALARVAPRSTVLVPQPGPYTKEGVLLNLRGVGRAADVRRIPATVVKRIGRTPGGGTPAGGPAAGGPVDPMRHVVARGGRDGARPWAIATRQRPGTSGGRFVLLQWPLAAPTAPGPDGSRHAHLDLLLDTALLPDDLRTDIVR